MADDLKQTIAAKSDKDLVVMLTHERDEYLPDAIALAEQECRDREISRETIEAFLAKDPLQDRLSLKVCAATITLPH